MAALVLVLWPAYLPMMDAPNHLARLTILAAPGGSALRQMYDVVWAPIPNLGLDLAFVALRHIMSPACVLRLCVLFSVVSICGSACLIQITAFGRLSWSVAFVPIVVFGSAWHMGLINYLMGVGVALSAIAALIRMRCAAGIRGGALLSAFGLLALVCHVAAFAALVLVLGGMVCADELARPGRASARVLWRKCLLIGLVCLPGLIFYALGEKPAHTWGVAYAPAGASALLAKLLLPLRAAFGTGSYVDVQIFGLTIVLFLILAWSGGLRVWRTAQPAILLLAVAVVVMPTRIDNATLVDERLMLVLTVLALSCTEIGSPLRRIRTGVAMAAVAGLIGFRVETMLSVENRHDWDLTQFRAIAGMVHERAKVLMATDSTTRADCGMSPVDLGVDNLDVHVGSFLTIDDHAFVPLIFAGRGMQPVRARAGYATISSPASVPVPLRLLWMADDRAKAPQVDALMRATMQDRYVFDWRHRFDDMLVLHHGCARNPFPRTLTTLTGGRFFTIYRIEKSAGR